VEDREIVAAIVAGDPAGLAEAYDRYATALFTYCRTLLRESADASDAVQDTFIIASAKVGQLRDPAKLRTWLYAVARNECYRRLRGREIAPGLDEVPDMTDESATVGAQAERAELQQLVHDALIGMNTGDREVIELMIRHDFEGSELSEALGVSRNHAHAMLSRARNQLKTSIGALLVARTGRVNCAVLDDMLARWDGTMSILMRKQVNRHIENCEVCEDRRRRELAPAALFSLLPLAAVPPGVRERIMRLCSDDSPLAMRQRQRVLEHAGTFGPDGFPAAPSVPMFMRLRAARRGTLLAVPAAAALIVAVVVIIALAATGSSPASKTAAGITSPSQAVSSSAPAASNGAPASASPTPGSATSGSATSGSHPHQAHHASTHSGAGVSPTPGTGTTPASTPPAPTTSAPAPAHHPSPPPTHTSAPPAPSPSPSRSPAPAKGTLSVSSGEVTLTATGNGGGAAGSFILSAAGGAVSDYTITVSGGAGLLTVSPSSGSLSAGQTATIALTLARAVAFNQNLVIDPGGLSVTVTYSPPQSTPTTPPPARDPVSRPV
jgi:RNA polymerase sigma factor (sigma-70 family)